MHPKNALAGDPGNLTSAIDFSASDDTGSNTRSGKSAKARLDSLEDNILAKIGRGQAEAENKSGSNGETDKPAKDKPTGETKSESRETDPNEREFQRFDSDGKKNDSAESESGAGDTEDANILKAIKALMGEGDSDGEDKAKSDPALSNSDKTDAKSEKADKVNEDDKRLDSLNRSERFHFDKAKGDPVRLAKNWAQSESHIKELQAELAEAMKFAQSAQPKFDTQAAIDRNAEELRQDYPEYSEAKIMRLAKAAAAIDKEDFESQNAPRMESFESFLEKQRKREQAHQAEFESVRSNVEKILLDQTDKNEGLTRHALDLAVKLANDPNNTKQLDVIEIIGEAADIFENEIVEHIRKAPGFGSKLAAVVAEVAERDESLVKRLTLNYLRKQVKPTGSKKTNSNSKAASPGPGGNNGDNSDSAKETAAVATGNKRFARSGRDIEREFDRLTVSAATRLGIRG